jgi:acyl transferase domain-containing protein/phosphopantetheinyl transferase
MTELLPTTTDGRVAEPDGVHEGIAVIGLACKFPGAPDVTTFWRNILEKVDCVSDPPEDGWDTGLYHDAAFADQDKVYVRKGGYLGGHVTFDPRGHGVPPMSVGGEPDQWLALQLAHDAMVDAGCRNLPEEVRKRTGVVLGKGTYLNGGNVIAVQRSLVLEQTLDVIRQVVPDFPEERLEQVRAEIKATLPPLGPETVPGLIPNVIVGRIANRLDLMGPTYTVDAACASSLVAVQLAMRDLRSGECDLAIAGGSQVWMPVPALNVFCRLGALSRSERIRPFDKNADGTLLGEGIGMVVLKRLSDAVRDGDRIYSVLRGIGVASDGRGVGVMAPRVEGEELALRRAYQDAGVDPSTIGLIEAHGTATPVGDVVEVQALRRVFGERVGDLPPTALGSVKSMISHTIPAAGIASIIKTSLALYHRVLPPTLNVEEPNPKLELETSPFYLNTETRPWISSGETPRRAGVNAFGFGGINAHAVLEEFPRCEGDRHLPDWTDEVLVLEAASPDDLRIAADRLATAVRREISTGDRADRPSYRLIDIAAAANAQVTQQASASRLAIVASSLDDLAHKLEQASAKLAKPNLSKIKHASGIYYAAQPLGRDGNVVFVFPGEGAQYPGMLADLCLHFPEVRRVFDRADRTHQGQSAKPSDVIFPRPGFSDEERRSAEAALVQMNNAIEAVLTANAAMTDLMATLGITPDLCVGHSAGEYSAAFATGLLDVTTDEAALTNFGRALQECYAQAEALDGVPRAALLAVAGDRDQVASLVARLGSRARIALDNCPHQTVVVGPPGDVAELRAELTKAGLICELLEYDRAVHTPEFAPYAAAIAPVFADVRFGAPRIPLWSSATASAYPAEPAAVRQMFVDQWTLPVEFRRTVERLHDEGARIFIEVGPRGNLTAFIDDILRGKPSLAVPSDVPRRRGTTSLNHLMGLLSAHGVSVNFAALYSRREPRPVDWASFLADEVEAPATKAAPIRLLQGWPAFKLDEDARARVAAVGGAIEPAAPSRLSEPSYAPAADLLRDESETLPAEPIPPAGEPLPPTIPPAGNVFAVPADSATDVMARHLETMDHFLSVHEQIVGAYLTGSLSVEQKDVHVDAYPLLGQVTVLQPGEELLAHRRFDPVEDRYLQDHTFGRDISNFDPDAMALAVMPMTMSLEIVAEAAACLLPHLQVVGLSGISASRWLAWDGDPQFLEVTARRIEATATDGHERVSVQLRNVSETDGADSPSTALVEATVILGPRPLAPTASTVPLPSDARQSGWRPELLYSVGMFHGPSWQGVRSVDVTGRDGAVATLHVLPTDQMIASDPAPRFVLDPVVLDAAGQLIGYWAAEALERGQIVFPFACDSLEIFGPAHRPVGDILTCVAHVTGMVGDQIVASDIEVLDAQGLPWLRLRRWQDKRFDATQEMRSLLGSGPTTISQSWPVPVEMLGMDATAECRILAATMPPDSAFWTKVWATRFLSPRERQLFQALGGAPTREIEWLSARTAAKEAVQSLLADVDISVQQADIEVLADEEGRPTLAGEWLRYVDFVPRISLAHTGGCAIAVAAWPAGRTPFSLGVDVERITGRPAGFATLAFSPDEQQLLDSLPGSSEEWTLRFWCAKESVAKTLGTGLLGDPRTVGVVAADASSGLLHVQLRGALAQQAPPELQSLVVPTLVAGDLVFAITATTCATASIAQSEQEMPASPARGATP